PLPRSTLFPYTTLFRSSTSAMQKRFSEEFKIEAVRQTTERGHKVADVAARLGVSTWSLYQWRKQYAGDEGARREAGEQAQEVRRDRKSTRLNSSHVKIS